MYQELGLKSLQSRRWLRRLCFFHNIYQQNYLPIFIIQVALNHFNAEQNFFPNSFLPCSVNNWNKLDPSRRCTEFHSLFRKKLLEFTRLIGNSIYRIPDPVGIEILNSLRVGFSYLRKHKFRRNFADTINLIRACAI